MTLLALAYADDFSLHDIVVNLTWQLVGTEMTKASWGGDLVFEDPGGGENWGGESKFSPTCRGEPTPLDTMLKWCPILSSIIMQKLERSIEFFWIKGKKTSGRTEWQMDRQMTDKCQLIGPTSKVNGSKNELWWT